MNELIITTRAELEALIERAVKRAVATHTAPSSWLSQDEAAALIGVARSTIPVLCKRDGLPHHRVARLYRFKRDEVEAWVASRSSARGTLRAIKGGR